MNWETAKTWLITVFFVLDLLLAWQWLQSRHALLGFVESTSDRLANTKTLLAEHGLALDTQVPAESPDMASLHGEYPAVKLADLAKAAFPGARIKRENDQTNSLVAVGGSTRILEPGTWSVTFTPPIRIGQGGLPNLYSRVWHSSMYSPDSSSSTTGETVLLEHQAGYPLFDVGVTLEANKSHLTGYTQNAIINVNPAGAAKPVIAPLDALDDLAVSVDKSSNPVNNKILKMDLGYLRKVSTNPFTASTSSSTYWFPVWRVVTDQQIYYINAFSGEVES